MPLSPKILVAEDDSGIREILRTHLSSAGYDVQVARDGLEAMALIRQWRPDAMVLDINMPGLDGFGVLRAITQDHLPPPRTLVLTARHAAADVKQAIGLGAKDYLSKPFTEAQLLGRIARLVRKVDARPADELLI